MIIKENQVILIPVDFSKQSYIAVKQSYGLAKHTKSKLVLMHVPNENEDRSDDLQKLAESTREESGLTVDTVVEKGDFYELVSKKAEDLGASLMIYAIDENAKFKTGFLGRGPSVSKFIREAPCPVITLKSVENREGGIKNIVMPFDLTPESREKVSFAVQLAHYFNADIRIVSVFKPNDDEYENRLLPYLKQVKKFIKQEGVSCTNRSLPSNKPAEAIVEYAVKNSGDLIIQISKRDLSFMEMINGTLDQKIMELSPIPVLNVHPMKRESTSHFSSGI